MAPSVRSPWHHALNVALHLAHRRWRCVQAACRQWPNHLPPRHTLLPCHASPRELGSSPLFPRPARSSRLGNSIPLACWPSCFGPPSLTPAGPRAFPATEATNLRISGECLRRCVPEHLMDKLWSFVFETTDGFTPDSAFIALLLLNPLGFKLACGTWLRS